MTKLALCRHGQSEWNLQNRFTGWVDVDLTEKGVAEARLGGELLAAQGIRFDAAFTSFQTRAIRTLWLGLEAMDQCYIPVTKDWHLNERHYGGLSGLNKQETRDKHGDEQVHIWRRSFDVPPPIVGPEHKYHPSNDPRYAGIDPAKLPGGESLQMTLDRVIPYFDIMISPQIIAGKTLLISAHGNSLRALLKHLFHVSDDDIPGFEVPTGNPLVIDLADGTLNVTAAKYLDESRAKPLPPI
ncbi:MAG: 2,3-diphosphoglycerate-dependent phosphoglycerate mutase [Robiginitomaculum sp.]|nr:MAG: 2,3-diphosphoglycerate-dependent phosphoglycerate mutase [Robiginitomaculum sp.]